MKSQIIVVFEYNECHQKLGMVLENKMFQEMKSS